MPTWKLYREGGEVVETELERWRWEIRYRDGSALKQFGDDGIYHPFKDIKHENIYSFSMVSDEGAPITILWSDEYKLIHFYRTAVLNFGLENETRTRLYFFGYQDGHKKTIFAILPNNSIAVVDDADKVTIEV